VARTDPADDLADCQFFLVDDDCGRAVGVVDDVVGSGPGGPARLLVAPGWGRRRVAVPAGDVVAVVPGRRLLVVACRTGHRSVADATGSAPGVLAGVAAAVRSWTVRLGRRRDPGRER
jgi:hypothetical protein